MWGLWEPFFFLKIAQEMESIHQNEADSMLGAPMKMATMPRWQRKALEQQQQQQADAAVGACKTPKTPRKTPQVSDMRGGRGGKPSSRRDRSDG